MFANLAARAFGRAILRLVMNDHDASSSRAVTRTAIATSVTVGVLGLVGYSAGIRGLVAPGPSWEVMTPIGAVSLIVAALGLWALERPGCGGGRALIGRAAGAFVTAGALAVLAEYIGGQDLRVDLLLFPETVAAWMPSGSPGRPLPHTAAAYLMAGLALLVLDVDTERGFRPAQFLASGVALVTAAAAVVSAVRLVEGQERSQSLMPATAIVGIGALATGLLGCRPQGMIARVLRSRGAGGAVVRRMTLIGAGAAVVAGISAAVLHHVQLLADDLVLIGMISLPLILLYVMLLRTGSSLDLAERGHRDLVEKLQEKNRFSRAVVQSLAEGVLTVDHEGTVLEASPRWSELTGFPVDVVLGIRPPYPWWPEDVAKERLNLLAHATEDTDRQEFEGPIRRADGTLCQILGTICPIRDDRGNIQRVVVTYRDLTERYRAADEKRRMAEQLDHFFTMSYDLMCIAGVDGYFKQLNPAWERMLGHPIDHLTSRPYLDFVHPDDRERTIAQAAQLEAGEPVSVVFENRFRRADGRYLWLGWNATAAQEDGLLFAVARDYTAKHEADDNRARLAAIVNSTADAVIGEGLDGTINSWNPAAERIYGYSAEEALGRSIDIIFPPEDHGKAHEALASLARGETVKAHDVVRRRKDGGTVRVATTSSPIRDANGLVIGAASIAHDITETKRTEELFHRLVLSAPDAMVIVDAAGSLRLVNEQAEQMFGYDNGTLTGRPVELLLPEQLRDIHVRHREQYLSAPAIRNMRTGIELYGVRKDGERFPIEVSLAPLRTDEETLVAAAIRDVTERREIERALALGRDEALAAGRLKSQFVAMVSHEIRTPMNGVIGLTNLLLDTQLMPIQRRYAESISTSARALLTIINDILDFSKIEAGKITLADTDIDLGDLIDEIAYAVAEGARGKPVEVRTEYPPGLPGGVRGDIGRLRQILLNLAGNAVKFTTDGEVVISLDRNSDDGYHFSVSDTGIGIGAEDLNRLFEPFVQADSTVHRQAGGTGLGLTISHQLVELMGGTLQADSELGRGSCFHFTISLPSTAQTSARPTSRQELSGRQLLIVDAGQTGCRHLVRHARAWGMRVTTVPNADDAITFLHDAALRDDPCRHVVVDDASPRSSGAEIAQRIRTDTGVPTPALILLSTTFTQVPDGIEILLKPVGLASLCEKLMQTLRPAAPMTGPALAETPTHRGDVLVAEDNEINQMVAIYTLAGLGYRADIASDGLKALELAATKSYKVIFMDCQMPNLDGFEATRELRRREAPGNRTPVIAMTASALADDRQRCLDSGMDDHLTKPIDPQELESVIAKWAGIGSENPESLPSHPATPRRTADANPKKGRP